MGTNQQAVLKEGDVRPTCCHYWVIEAGNGATSPGVCAFCGERREFTNNLFICMNGNGEKIVDDGRGIRPKKNGQNNGKNGAQVSRPRYTIEDYRRWGKMGGRGNKKNREA